MRRRTFLVLAVLLAALVASQAAIADIDVQAGRALKARSTLLPAGELETYRFDATAGTRLTFTIAAARGTSLLFNPSLLDPDGAEVALSADIFTPASRIKVSNLSLGKTGSYRLVVAAQGTGEYALSLKSTPRTAYAPSTLTIPAGDTRAFLFSAPPGSTVTLKAKAAAKDQATPRFGLLAGTVYSIALGAEGRATATSHDVKVAGVGAPGDGDFGVEVSNTAAAGDVVVSATVKPPRAKSSNLDLRSARLDHPAGGETFVLRLIGPGGGSVEVTDLASDLAGTSLTIPAGALASGLPISVASAPTPPLPGTDQAAGPAVELRPSGTTFNAVVTVTLPFDFARLPANATPADIRVLIREANGTTRTVIPSSIDTINGTITLQTSGFSTFVPIVRAGIPQLGLTPEGDAYWLLSLASSLGQEFQLNDSRTRDFRFDIGEATFFGGGLAVVSGERGNVRVENPDAAGGGVDGSVLSSGRTPFGDTGNWSFNADGASITINGIGGESPVFDVSLDGSVMVGKGRNSTSPTAEIALLLRKNTTPLTLASLAGTYALAAVEISPNSGGPGSPARAEPSRALGTFTFDGKGGVRGSATQRESNFDQASGTWQSEIGTLALTASYEIEAAGTVLLTIAPKEPGDDGDILRLFPGPGGASFVGTDRDASESNLFALFLVKQGSGLGLASLSGPYRGAEFATEVSTYVAGTVPPITIPDLAVEDGKDTISFDGTKFATLATDSHRVRRRSDVQGGVLIESDTDAFDVIVALDSKGKLKIKAASGDGGVEGAMSANAMFGFFLGDLGSASNEHLLGFLVKTPPPLN